MTFESSRRFTVSFVSIYRISQLAERAGVPATTLRFYEKEGLLPSARTPSGYRQYSDADRERVQFITAAKHLGLRLDQIRELLGVWEGGRCRDVRDELWPLIVAQVAAAVGRIDDLRVFRGRLSAALTHLQDLPAREGPCDPACSFLHDLPGRPPTVTLTPRSGAPVAEDVPIAPVACSLDGGAYRERIGEWGRLLQGAEVQMTTDGGYVVRLPAGQAERVVQLVVAEQQCCPFFAFQLTFNGPYIDLEAHAPEVLKCWSQHCSIEMRSPRGRPASADRPFGRAVRCRGAVRDRRAWLV